MADAPAAPQVDILTQLFSANLPETAEDMRAMLNQFAGMLNSDLPESGACPEALVVRGAGSARHRWREQRCAARRANRTTDLIAGMRSERPGIRIVGVALAIIMMIPLIVSPQQAMLSMMLSADLGFQHEC